MNTPAFTHFGRYRILDELGRGAMGIVYRAEDASLQRQVAVKAMLLPGDSAERVEHEGRFRQEAKAAGGLNHPNIITIHDLGREGDWLYIAMELLRGTELRSMMALGPMDLPLALDLAAQVAQGLAAAHAHGVVHRDVKPSNIMVLEGRHAKIMDFGVARMQASELRTRSGVLLGSPKYMSPEQVGGHPVDARSDIFSLGSVLYEMVTGVPAFTGQELGGLLYAILHTPPPSAGSVRADVPPMLDLVIGRAMQKNANARYQDAREFARDLLACRAELLGTPVADALAITVRAGTDAFATTAKVDATLTLGAAGPSYVPARDFDSTEALRRLFGAQGAPPASVKTAGAWPWGWTLACGVAVLAAVAIAFA